MRIAALALLLIGFGLQGVAPRAEERRWRLGEPEVVWRYESPAEGHDIGTLAVHPDDGVVAVARQGYARIALFRISASGLKLWECRIAVRGWADHAHVTFLRRGEGVDTIVAAPGRLAVLDPTGAVRWARSAAEIGIDSIGVAIARHAPGGDWIVVGGEGISDQGEPVAMAAGLTGDGTRRWLAVGPWPAAASSAHPRDEAPPDTPTVALPLRVLDDGGAVMLVGCGLWAFGSVSSPDPGRRRRVRHARSCRS